MLLEVFDVEHGACSLITTAQSRRIMVDCGSNSSSQWSPGNMLLGRGASWLERLIITNFDEDHAAGFLNLDASVSIMGLQRNGQVTSQLLSYMKYQGGMGSGIAGLADSFPRFTGPPLPPLVDDVAITAFSNPPGPAPFGFYDENNLSLCVFVTCGAHRVIFPGDLEKAGWQMLLRNPAFVAQLQDVTIFVASHHGRINGYCEDVMRLCPNIQAVVISDKGMGYESQETVPLYRAHAHGFLYDGGWRHVLTTRKDGTIRFDIPAVGRATVLLGAMAA